MPALLSLAGHLWLAVLAAFGVLAAGAWYGFPGPAVRAAAHRGKHAAEPVLVAAAPSRPESAAGTGAWRAVAPGLTAVAIVILVIAAASL